MDLTQESCRSFTEALASASPAPGGGGAAALVGAVGVALGNMVGSLTVGKKKYADVEPEIRALMLRCEALRVELLNQVEADERGFLPLARAYSIPRDDPRRTQILEEASVAACAVPLRIMELCAQALDCIALLAQKGSRLAVSDAGCGAVCCKAALQAAALNVFINTRGMQDRAAAQALDARTHALLNSACAKADAVYETVLSGFGQGV